MDRSPKVKSLKLSRKKVEDKDDTIIISQLSASSCPTSTPIRNNNVESEMDDSPCSGFTQDCDDMAVVWDWNSPRTKQKAKRKPRKLNVSSPKPSFQRHSSNNNQQHIFEKLKEELQALREEIAIPDDEDCLILSPLEEADFKNGTKDETNNRSALSTLIQDENHDGDKDFENIFNDSLDEELILCTQKVEDTLNKQNIESSNSYKKNTESKSSFVLDADNKLDDSLNLVLESFEDKEIELLSQNQKTCEKRDTMATKNYSSCVLRRTFSDMQVQHRPTKTATESGKLEFFRTHSFELSRVIDGHLPPDKFEEIERKRQEALAKLQSKRKKNSDSDISPIRYSPDEIEQKRLQAIAKLEAKKRQELEIERKRQEALKRLELNRKKRAISVKCSLEKRL